MILVLALAAVLFLAGAVAGILAVIAIGIHHEERAHSLTGKSPGRAASVARLFNGVYTDHLAVPQQPDRQIHGSPLRAGQERNRYADVPDGTSYGLARTTAATAETEQAA